jgi:signal recognition particle receptor subunit beta
VVTLVDTPGRGAVQRNHEILVEQFVPLADAIIFLIAADIPITASEKEFLKQLAQQEKERVFFVLTKRDAVEDKDINEVRRWVKDQISDAGMRCDRLFEVSARKVFEARRDGKDEATIEAIHRESGMETLQRELESFILATSAKNERTMTRLKGLLDYLRKFYEQAHAAVGESLSLISLDTDQVTREIDDLNDRAKKAKTGCDASLKKFKVAWSKSINQFRSNLQSREDRIADEIIGKISRGGLIGVASGSFKAKELIERSISNELQSLLPDLDLKLSEHVTALSAELESELETYKRVKAQSDFALPSAAILGLGGSAIALTQAFGATSAAVSTIIGILNQGALGKVGTWLVGGPTILSAATPAVLAIATAYAASWAAKKIIIAAQENRIPAMVTEVMNEIAQDVGVKLAERGDEIANTFRAVIDEQIETDRAKILEIEQSIKDSDPSIKTRLVGQADECKKLISQHNDLEHSLGLITSVQ